VVLATILEEAAAAQGERADYRAHLARMFGLLGDDAKSPGETGFPGAFTRRSRLPEMSQTAM
jgi:hypothetical protein